MGFLIALLVCAMTALNAPAGRAQDAIDLSKFMLPSIDFSATGYNAGSKPIPMVPAKIAVEPTGGDDTATIQAAIDRVASLPPDADGLRGAVLLKPGTFRIEGRLRLRTSGVVLRGSGTGEGGTTLIAAGRSRRTLIVAGGSGKPREIEGTRQTIAGEAPVGAKTITVESGAEFAVGDTVIVHRPSTGEWLGAIAEGRGRRTGGRQLNMKPGARDLNWDRTITAVEGNTIALDAPITMALEAQYGGGSLYQYTFPGRIENIGVENLRCVSEYDETNPKDENHSWIAIEMDAVHNAWVRNVTARHFAFSTVHLGADTKYISVLDCRSEAPVGENGEFRRMAFYTRGQMTRFTRCWAEQGRHDFAAGLNTAGPNVFLECVAAQPLGFVGPPEIWAAGTLYHTVIVEGGELWLADLAARKNDMGYAAANSVFYECKADLIVVDNPATGRNWAIACGGEFAGAPASVVNRETLEASGEYTRWLQRMPAIKIAGAPEYEIAAAGLPLQQPVTAPAPPPPAKPLEIVNGRFVAGGRSIIGNSFSVNWWKGHIAPSDPSIHGIGITRYAPGMTGQGLTDDLPALADRMAVEHIPFIQHWHGLWYDRRRDDHATRERPDEWVRAPFYEMPWARSGQDTAWDGLSKYDLTRFNSWFFERLAEFGDLAADKGLVLYHSYYNNHNFVESAAHWSDYPWRPANNINDTGMTEPPPYVEGGRIYIADEFYDLSDATRRELHELYIRHTLDKLGAAPNIVHSLAFQYAGPLEFQRFYLDVIKAWSKENDADPKVMLMAAKDVTDAILEDPAYAPMIDVIDMRYWQYTKDGELYAPAGGQNRAFRELRREFFTGQRAGEIPPPTLPANVYKQVREYRDSYPDKALVALQGWAGALPVLMAGGAQAVMTETDKALEPEPYPLFATLDRLLGDRLHRMNPVDGLAQGDETTWCLAEPGKAYAVTSLNGAAVRLDMRGAAGDYKAHWVNATTGTDHPIATGRIQNGPNGEPAGFVPPTRDEEWLLILIEPEP